MDPATKQVLGYAFLATGMLDVLAAAFVGLAWKGGDPRSRRTLSLVMGLAGFAFLAAGALLLLGVL